MDKTVKKREKRQLRHRRVRSRVFGTKQRPRLSVFRSASHIYAQLIDDENGRTLAHVSSLKLASSGMKKIDVAKRVGEELAAAAKKKGIEKVSFDRGGYAYHGRVKALAEGARAGGLKF